MDLDNKRFIGLKDSEVPLDINSDCPDGRDPKALGLFSELPYDLKWVKTEILKTLDFWLLLEEYRKQAFHKNNPDVEPSHRYKRLKKIFDELMEDVYYFLNLYQIPIISQDRSGTILRIRVWDDIIILELVSWDIININGIEYHWVQEYIGEVLYWVKPYRIEQGRILKQYEINNDTKLWLGIQYEWDYLLFDVGDGYVAVPASLWWDFIKAHNIYEKDGWSHTQLNYNFTRTTENRSVFISKEVWDTLVLKKWIKST